MRKTKFKLKNNKTKTFGIFYHDEGSLIGPLHGFTYKTQEEAYYDAFLFKKSLKKKVLVLSTNTNWND